MGVSSMPDFRLDGKQHCGALTYYVAMLHLPGGGVSMSGKEDGRDGESDTIRRR
jgi:hypothetical protein